MKMLGNPPMEKGLFGIKKIIIYAKSGCQECAQAKYRCRYVDVCLQEINDGLVTALSYHVENATVFYTYNKYTQHAQRDNPMQIVVSTYQDEM